MSTYLVTWEIEIDAISCKDAAKAAREIMLDPDSTATVFKVAQQKRDKTYYSNVTIDLMTKSRNPHYYVYIPDMSVTQK